MENLSGALKQVSIAVSLESNGFIQAAFSEYIHGLQALIICLNDNFMSLGFEKMVENKKEGLRVLNMIHECSDRMSVILNEFGQSVNIVSAAKLNSQEIIPEPNFFPSKVSAFEKVQKENAKLFKMYKMRLDKVNDKLTKTNLNLEFQRRVAENVMLAKRNYDSNLKQLQEQHMMFMENGIRKLCENNENLNEKEQEKCQLFNQVLQYVKTEIWPCAWKLNFHNVSTFEMCEKVFQKIVRCFDHPLAQWLIFCHTNIKRKIDDALAECKDYIPLLPELKSDFQLKYYSVQEHCDCVIIKLSHSESALAITSSKQSYLEDLVTNISSDIKSAISDALEIFYFSYKSVLPEDSESVCYHIIEKHFLKSLLPSLSLLFRSSNLPSECKLAESMHLHQKCNPCKFKVDVGQKFLKDLVSSLFDFLKHQSIVMKIKTLVLVSKKICEVSAVEDDSGTMLGADEMIPLLSYIILQSRIPQLISECNLLEHLFDMKYMLGEEGYALSSFLAALKCVDMMKLTECDSKDNLML